MNIIVLIDNQVVTNKIEYIKYNAKIKIYKIKFKYGKIVYTYSSNRVNILENFNLIDLNEYYIFLNNTLLNDINEVLEFQLDDKYYYQVKFNNNILCEYSDKQLKKVCKSRYRIIQYMKEIAEVISISTEDGRKLLNEQLNKIRVEDFNNALANYLKFTDEIEMQNKIEYLIFPFGCNASQYNAVYNAIYNKMSVIEGPPGTGKTQTIMNIIANIIVRDMNCQVVSNNNTAIKNIKDKLQLYELDFIVAILGSKANKDLFVDIQRENVPVFEETSGKSLDEIINCLKEYSSIVKKVYDYRNEVSLLKQKYRELSFEYKHYINYLKAQNLEVDLLNRFNVKCLKKIWNELIIINDISLWKKIKYVYLYGIGDFKFYKNDMVVIFNAIQNQLYKSELVSIEKQISEKELFIKINAKYERDYINLSMDYFKKYLTDMYKGDRKRYNLFDIKGKSKDFIKDYPVILSTTYSSRNTFDNLLKFDYIIMDESSQVDIVTGLLSLSSSKYAVIVGDEKQLPTVISEKTRKDTDKIYKKYNLEIGYNYSLNSFLDSVKQIITNVPVTLLKEHYRCHPKIIGFCNKKFYNNQLVIMTEDNSEKDVLNVIKTNIGNHSRDNSNQRQLDIIKELIPRITSKDIGIITPYNNQVNLIKNYFPSIEVSTVHKFQGRDKDVIIISTVDDNITDFVANNNILNVAISRARKQLFFLVTGNSISNRNINDFINYVYYNNMQVIKSDIYSVFDLLYKQYESERLDFYKKHSRVSKFDSENLIYYMLKDIVKDYDNLDFIFLQPMSLLIKDKGLLNERERQYVSCHYTHIDFLIYNKFSKNPVLAIEVDGHKYHKLGTQQYQRDLLKDSILKKYGIPIIRLKTNGSGEEKRIRDMISTLV